MKRKMTGFRLDDEGDWVALLDCGHPQHVRHRPPFFNRPWVTTEEGRSSRLGGILNCVRCDRFELPDHFISYKQTPVFTEASMPAGIMSEHATKAGIWAKIFVTAGTLRYQVEALDMDIVLSEGQPGIVVPEVVHRVVPLGAVQFFVTFYRAPEEVG